MRISEGLQLRVKDLDFDHGDHRAGGQRLKDRALMLPESLAPSLREQLSRALGMVAEGPGRGPQRRCFPDALERKYPRAGHSGRGSGFLRSTRIRPIHGAVSCVAITCMTRPFSAFKRAVEQAGITKPATAHPPPLVRDGLAPQRLRHSNRAGSARPFRRLYDDDLHACAESWQCRVRSPLDALPPLTSER